MYNRYQGTGLFLVGVLTMGVAAVASPALGQVITEDFKLLADDEAPVEFFGNAIAMDNGVVVVAAHLDDDNDRESGSAYLFDATTGLQIAKLLPLDGRLGDQFGFSVAIHNGIVAVGAPYDDDNGYASGSVYLFDAATGEQIAKLLPDDGAEFDRFGWSVAIDNGVVAVGAINAGYGDYGAAYTFDAATGAQIATLFLHKSRLAYDFGSSIAIDDGVVAIGTPGRAYLFDAFAGTHIARLFALDVWVSSSFGWTVAIDNGVVAVGARGDDDNGSGSGSAYLFDVSTGTQITKLLPSDGAAGDLFGSSVSIADGFLVVGARAGGANSSGPGSAYLFDTSTGAEIQKFVPGDGVENDRFGWAVAADRGLVAVAAFREGKLGPDMGAAYLFDATSGTQTAKLVPVEGHEEDLFGRYIAMDQGVIAVTAWSDGDFGLDSGSAYLFDAATGAQIAKILPTDGDELDRFGTGVAINDGIVAIGAFFDGDNGSRSGSAYLFDASTGAQIAKLLPNDGEPDDYFGLAVALDDGVVAVGAPGDDDNGSLSGSVYLFSRSSGEQIAKVLPSDGREKDRFGASLAMDRGVLAVGADGDDGVNDFKSSSGSVYLYEVSTGALITKLYPNDSLKDDRFGSDVAIAHGIIVVGAPGKDNLGEPDGAAYIFDVSTGAQIAKLIPNDAAHSILFGYRVAIGKGIVAVGAPGRGSDRSKPGAVYLFSVSTGEQYAKLVSADGEAEDSFGIAIAVSNGVIAIGAPGDDDQGSNSGSAYVFDVSCRADLTGDFMLDFFDVEMFLTAYGSQDPLADFTGDGVFDFFDVQVFLTAYAAGCP